MQHTADQVRNAQGEAADKEAVDTSPGRGDDQDGDGKD